MILPDCNLNPYPGRWLITLESDEDEDNTTLENVTSEEPIDTLERIRIDTGHIRHA